MLARTLTRNTTTTMPWNNRCDVHSPVESVPEGEVLESGWDELGISDERASEIATAMVDEEDASNGMDFYRVRTHPPAKRLPGGSR